MSKLPAVAVVVLALCLPAGAYAAETARLSVTLSPDRLGASTTITFRLAIGDTSGPLPAPLTGLDLRMPAGIGLLDSQLGLAACNPSMLLSDGVAGCPENARMGYGHASVRFLFGPALNEAQAALTVLRGEAEERGVPLLVYTETTYPVFLALVFPSLLGEDSGLFGAQLSTELPPIPTLPDAPDVSITALTAALGPAQLRYHRVVHGRSVVFTPRGLSVPTHCHRGGFPFAARLSFMDGTQLVARASVRCPARRRRRR